MTIIIVLFSIYVIIGYIYVGKTMVFNKEFQGLIEWCWGFYPEISEFEKCKEVFLLLLKSIFMWPRLVYLNSKNIINR